MSAIIQVENLGKKYTIRHEHPERYVALRDVLTQKAQKLFSFPANLRPKAPTTDYEEFWALKDLNFEIQQGDRVGIIGRNGAGKSTLLKILSRITEPSTGRITLNGRVASLLEVGTGFHPELTGRENIFLNGAILGMSRVEIRRKFDEIVDFSGVEKFLDTPVKRYSSGMYVRLAFAVAAHLEPEILVVDEVLAVGDAEFQKKCLGKMDEVSKNGRTVLFVSHNMSIIQKLCNKGILLNEGSIKLNSSIEKIIENYLITEQEKTEDTVYFFTSKKDIRFSKLTFLNSQNIITNKFCFGEPFEIQVEIETNFDIDNISVLIGIDSLQSERISTSLSDYTGVVYNLKAGKKNIISARFENLLLHPNTYNIVLATSKGRLLYDKISNAGRFTILDIPFKDIYPYNGHWGKIRINPKWL